MGGFFVTGKIPEKWRLIWHAVLQEAVVPITVSVRPIEPQGKLIGFASVNFGGVVIDDFKVVDGKNGIFLGAPWRTLIYPMYPCMS